MSIIGGIIVLLLVGLAVEYFTKYYKQILGIGLATLLLTSQAADSPVFFGAAALCLVVYFAIILTVK